MIPQNVPLQRKLIGRHWLTIFLVVFGLWNLIPFLAPVLMKAGWESGGKAVYTFYSPFCHQMAQRSFFFFGEKVMYNADELPLPSQGASTDMLLFRQYRGDEQFGWKVAWSDRMVYMYGSLWLAALFYAGWRRNQQRLPLSLFGFILFLLPMAIDGGTHFLSDLEGLTQGFRYTNEWLATLTGHVFPSQFYVGDGLGSFNAFMRLFSGVTFGIGSVWFSFPYLERTLTMTDTYLTEHDNRLEELKEQMTQEVAG